MKRNLGYAAVLAILCAIFAAPAFSQYGSVKGTCKDAQGNPIADAQVVWHNDDNGRTTNLKTNKKGEYFSLGIESGKYTITLSKDGKELDSIKNFHVGTEDTLLDFDLKKSQEQAVKETAKQTGLTPEQIKQRQEAVANVEKHNASAKAVNEKFNAATAAVQPPTPDYDKAIALLTEAVGMAPDESKVWYRRGQAYLDSVKGLTDPAEKTKRNAAAYSDLQKAIELQKDAMSKTDGGSQPAKTSGQGGPSDKELMAAYYDDLGAATSRLGKIDEATSAYGHASEYDPTNGKYYFNLGAVLTNANLSNDLTKRKQAIDAFDKSIAADPNGPTVADAYFWKGQNLMGMATFNKENKMVVPDGTVEAYQKYLELKPTGNHAQEAKDMLTALNSTVETSFGGKKTTKKKE